MLIKSIKLNNFRIYQEKEFRFDPGCNLIIGKNGSGKTSILEAVYLLSLGKSFRTSTDENLINLDSENLFIKGLFQVTDDPDLKIIFSIDKKKNITINDKIIHRLSDLIGKINITLFLEQDIDLIERSPIVRRKFINILFSQIDNDYLRILIHYNKILEQRNYFLKNSQPDPTLLAAFNENLIHYGSELIFKRHNYLNKFYKIYQETVQKFDIRLLNNILIQYHPAVTGTTDGMDLQQIRGIFSEKLASVQNQEEKFKFTMAGPHRDDLLFLKDKKYKFQDYSSAGEKRLLAVFLKMAETQFMMQIKKEIPILLMDDIILELDKTNINILITYINSIKNQVIITTTEEREQEYSSLSGGNEISL